MQAIFDAASELNPDHRDEFLREQCSGDKQLEQEVRSLLEADQEQHSLLDGLAVDYVSHAESVEYEGRQVGPYTLGKMIGSGGMGLVFIATRTDRQFRREVALKLIREGRLTEEIKRRFEGERQILARLDHPNIARLFDVGFAENGCPYFTMEYVDGAPIDEYCRENNLTIEERLGLFLQVCDAVEYAQNKAVIHRDLKPSNVLVTSNREAKLLDFGIAKLISEDATHAMTELTRTGMRVMTPAYAAPEQIRGEPVSAATDVYSLGVILYELLTDQRPYSVKDSSQHELEHAICSTDPVKPSIAVDTDTQNLLAGQLSTEEHDLEKTTTIPRLQNRSRRLRGDLDNICLMALRKEPERRYQNAAQLIADINRHIEGRPVIARSSTLGYRLQKFLQRNAAVVITGLAASLLVIFLISYYTIQLTKERDLARQESQKAAVVSDFLTEMFEIADPGRTRGETITARELLERGVKRINDDLDQQPQIRAELLHVIGNVYYGLGLYEESLRQLMHSLELYRNLGGNALAEGSILHGMANATDALGRTDSALVLFQSSMTIFDQLEPNADAMLARAAAETDMAVIYRHRGEYAVAESLYSAGLAVRREQLGEVNDDVAHSLNHIGRLYYNQGDYERAEPYLREALSIRLKLLGDRDPATLASFGAIAGLYSKLGRYDSSRVYFGKALTGFQKSLGEDHPYSVASMSSYGSSLFEVGELDSAKFWHEKALSKHSAIFPPGHIRRSYSLLGLGEVYIARGEYIEAEDYLKRALQIRRNNLPADHVNVADVELQLGKALMGQTRFEEAREILERSLDTFMQRRGLDDQNTQQVLSTLTKLYEELNERTELERVSRLLMEQQEF